MVASLAKSVKLQDLVVTADTPVYLFAAVKGHTKSDIEPANSINCILDKRVWWGVVAQCQQHPLICHNMHSFRTALILLEFPLIQSLGKSTGITQLGFSSTGGWHRV